MAVLPAPGDDTVMLEGGSSSNPRYAVPASAHALQRAAGALQTGAGSPQAVESLPATVAHLEEALDRLATGVERMALAVAEWSESGSEILDEDALPPDARALSWHLHTTAQALSSSRDDRFGLSDETASSSRPSGRADAIGLAVLSSSRCRAAEDTESTRNAWRLAPLSPVALSREA
jgi:hypothetical protein